MSKHTQEVWQITGDNKDFIYALGPNGYNKFWFAISTAGDDKIGIEEVQANARLIAAAPDLLAALIGLDEAFCSLNEFSTKEERHDARLKLIAARAAVAKATG